MNFWKRKETELEREIAHHIHHLAAEYERQGHPRQEALLMARREFEVRVELGRGNAEQCVWTSDLSYDYVKINAEYRT